MAYGSPNHISLHLLFQLINMDILLEKLLDMDPGAMRTSLTAQLKVVLDGQHTTYDGNIITIEFLIEKYAQYKKWWDVLYGDKDPQYIAKADKLQGLSAFLMKNMYEMKFVIPRKKRDQYLFGSMTESYMDEKLDEFYKLLGHERIKESQETSESDDKPF